MIEYIERTRTKFGSAPRKFSFFQRLDNHLMRPSWMSKDNPLACIYQDQKILLTGGVVVWGHIVQANSLLYEPGSRDLPAVALFSLDPHFDESLADLSNIADSLYQLKGMQAEDKEISQFVEAITDEYEVLLNQRMPKSVTSDREVYYTTIVVHREHLPVNYLKSTWFPLLVKPEETNATIILPAKYWDAELVTLWKDTTDE